MPNLNDETLSDERLIRSVGPQTFAQGQEFFRQGQVEVIEIKPNLARCLVQDKHPYKVEIKLANKYLYFKCDCRVAYIGQICAHEVAASMAIRRAFKARQTPPWRSQMNHLLDTADVQPRRSIPSKYFLFFSLQETEIYYEDWDLVPYTLSLKTVEKISRQSAKETSEPDIPALIETFPALADQANPPYRLLNPEGCLNSRREAVLLANIILDQSRAYTNSSLKITPGEALQIISDSDCPLYWGGSKQGLARRLQIMQEPGILRLNLERRENDVIIQLQIGVGEMLFALKTKDEEVNVHVLQGSPLWVLAGDRVIKLEDSRQAELLAAFLNNPEIRIPSKDEKLFRQRYFLPLARLAPLAGDVATYQEVQELPVGRLYLSESEGTIQAELRFGYGESEVAYDPSLPDESLINPPDSWSLVRVKRQPEFETRAYKELTTPHAGLKRSGKPDQPAILHLRARLHPVDFLLHRIPHLLKSGYEVYGEESLKSARVNRNSPTIRFNISSGIDWFDLQTVIQFGEQDVAFKDIRRALRKKERYVMLADGTIGEIPAEWIERYKHLFGLGEETADGLRLSHHHLAMLDALLAENEASSADAVFEDYRLRLIDFRGITAHEIPAGFTGELRPYQKAGFEWLYFLHENGFGGCLADDMGLGKTIQALVFLQSLREGCTADKNQSQGVCNACLLVVPRSLLVNWQREAARFTPGLQVLEYSGVGRDKDPSAFDQIDLVITTYGVMLRDIATLRRYNFHYSLLDESQAIKNPLSQTARAARLLQSQHRLALTGTPVENTTLELWSQFAFLNPGLLGNLEYFKTEFAGPIEKDGDQRSAELLRKIVYPFILRRTKDQVAPELPPRSERILYCDMEPAQRKLYERMLEYYRGVVLGMLDTQRFNTSHIKILEGLLRLRQICNHPRLVDEDFHGESAKFDLLLETLETLQAEGHKALVFSQFVQMLRLVRGALDERHIPYSYLDGSTRNRMQVVDEFQSNPAIPFFLISLKAGGQGLNLTAADYVLHIDPWWNPAVEMQASDRTHRIGQEKPVFIYKLIARDSVEEKILMLQDRKKALVGQIIATESAFYKSLTEEEVRGLFGQTPKVTQ
jgi:non-specific serine/threonine protein kinase